MATNSPQSDEMKGLRRQHVVTVWIEQFESVLTQHQQKTLALHNTHTLT